MAFPCCTAFVMLLGELTHRTPDYNVDRVNDGDEMMTLQFVDRSRVGCSFGTTLHRLYVSRSLDR